MITTLPEDMFGEEPLHEDLEPYLIDVPGIGKCLKHPLVFSIMYSPMMNKMLNQQYLYKLEALKTAKPSSYVFLHERPYRLQAFFDIADQFENHKEYWELLGNIWIDSENIHEHFEDWMGLLSADHSKKEFFMDDEDRQKLVLLPNDLIVYRGFFYNDSSHGFSWTLDKDKAEWFAKRFLHKGEIGKVLVGDVKKSKVIAYLTGRGEDEIVVLPNDVRVINTIKLRAKN